jgi:hypothetical protein
MATNRYGKSRLAFWVAVITVFVASAEARSDDPISRPTRAVPSRTPGPNSDSSVSRIGIDIGIGSAIGLIGVTYTRAFDKYILLEGGVGAGFTGSQLSLMPKLTLGPTVRSRYIMGVGVSLSLDSTATETGPEHQPHRLAVPWLNADLLGIELRSVSGFAFHLALGITMPMISYHWDFAGLGSTEKAWQPLPQMRIGIANWF